MRLINTRTGLFHWVDRPTEVPYAILSHVWDGDRELSFHALSRAHAEAFQSRETLEFLRLCSGAGLCLRLGGHLLHRQEQQRRAVGSHQLNACVVSASIGLLRLPLRCHCSRDPTFLLPSPPAVFGQLMAQA